MAIFIKGGGGGSGVALDGDYANPDQLGAGKSETAPGQAKQRLAADQTWSDPLEHFAESWDETYKVSALTGREDPNDAEATVDIALVPKGNGGLQAAIPDGTATGGAARGTQAVDWQCIRTVASDVAVGSYSTISGGYGNGITSAGLGAVIAGGANNVASDQYTAIIGGNGNTATNDYACAGGQSSDATGNNSFAYGNSCTASGTSAFAIGSASNATGNYSVALGQNTTASAPGAVSLGSASVSRDQAVGKGAEGFYGANVGWTRYILQEQTTNATPTVLCDDGSTASSANKIPVASDSTVTISGWVTARRTDADNESAGWKFEAVVDNNAGTTALVGSASVTAIGDDSGATWSVAVTANNTDDTIDITVTGEASKTIGWSCVCDVVHMKG